MINVGKKTRYGRYKRGKKCPAVPTRFLGVCEFFVSGLFNKAPLKTSCSFFIELETYDQPMLNELENRGTWDCYGVHQAKHTGPHVNVSLFSRRCSRGGSITNTAPLAGTSALTSRYKLSAVIFSQTMMRWQSNGIVKCVLVTA